MEERKITIEHLLIGAVFMLALLVRFIHLGQPPLNDYEAAPALQAMNIASGKETMIGDQPAYVMLTAGLFRLFDATDFGARLWPALAGANTCDAIRHEHKSRCQGNRCQRGDPGYHHYLPAANPFKKLHMQ